MSTPQQVNNFYRVRVGHLEVQVQAASADEAVEMARRRLAHELPRLYDVIRSLTIARFQVEPAV